MTWPLAATAIGLGACVAVLAGCGTGAAISGAATSLVFISAGSGSNTGSVIGGACRAEARWSAGC